MSVYPAAKSEDIFSLESCDSSRVDALYFILSAVVTSLRRGQEAERGRKSSELMLCWDINCGSAQAVKYMPL